MTPGAKTCETYDLASIKRHVQERSNDMRTIEYMNDSSTVLFNKECHTTLDRPEREMEQMSDGYWRNGPHMSTRWKCDVLVRDYR